MTVVVSGVVDMVMVDTQWKTYSQPMLKAAEENDVSGGNGGYEISVRGTL